MHPFWRDTLRHGLQVLAFCCVIAVFTTMMWPGSGYARQLVHSISIGMITWAVIEFGRLLVPAQHCHRNPDTGGHGWPRGWRGVALTAALQGWRKNALLSILAGTGLYVLLRNGF